MQDPDHTDIYGTSCFLNACYFNRNYLLIAMYLIESTDAKISFRCIPSTNGENNLGIKNNFERFNQVLDLGLKEYDQEECDRESLNLIVPRINPMLLISRSRRDLLTKYCIRDPFDNMFPMKDFIKFTDDLNCSLPVPVPVPITVHVPINTSVSPITVLSLDQDENIDKIDSMRPRSLVFVYNGDNYYADPEIVFNEIILFKEIKDILRFDEPVVLSCGSGGYDYLSSPCPKYLINLWLGSIDTKEINLMEIEPQDILSALDHIDRYPTESLSIKLIEHQLIRYFDQMTTECQSICLKYLIDLSSRYGLKYLYLWIHNQKIRESG